MALGTAVAIRSGFISELAEGQFAPLFQMRTGLGQMGAQVLRGAKKIIVSRAVVSVSGQSQPGAGQSRVALMVFYQRRQLRPVGHRRNGRLHRRDHAMCVIHGPMLFVGQVGHAVLAPGNLRFRQSGVSS